MTDFKVKGMSCAACVARVEKAVKNIEGVKNVSVSLMTASMQVESDIPNEKIIDAVVSAGYACEVDNKDSLNSAHENPLLDEFLNLRKRFTLSLIFLLPILYVTMGVHFLSFPSIELLNNKIFNGIYQIIFVIAIVFINRKIFISGLKGVAHGSTNMDTLVALGCLASFSFSLVQLILCVLQKDSGYFYFESVGMILTLMTMGKMLEAKSKLKTTNSLESLYKLLPQTAILQRDDKEIEVPIDEVKVGDIFIVKSGALVPVDGTVIEGSGNINESSFTGESIPVSKIEGSKIIGSTTCISGYVKCRADSVGNDTMFSKIIELVKNTSITKAPIARLADQISGIFVPVVIGIALVTLVVWLLLGADFYFALTACISVLVISCPCALGLATPASIMVGSGVAAKKGILFSTSEALEVTGKIDCVVFDKTGTLTIGEPKVTSFILTDYFIKNEETLNDLQQGSNNLNDNLLINDVSLRYGDNQEKVNFASNINKDLLLKAVQKAFFITGILEKRSEHPLAQAIIKNIIDYDFNSVSIDDFEVIAGKGVKGKYQKQEIICCSANYAKELLGAASFQQVEQSLKKSRIIDKSSFVVENQNSNIEIDNYSNIYLLIDGYLCGVFLLSDPVREDAKNTISLLKNLGIHTIILSGDNKKTASVIAKELGVDEVIAEVLPNEKAEYVKNIQQKYKKVMMCGDGINDAPALVQADVGVAIGSGTNVAIESADVVLVKNNTMDVVNAIELSRKVIFNIRENLFWAFIYNIIGIPLAAGCYYYWLNWQLTPVFGVFAMSLSSVCVVSNALRLNFMKLRFAKVNTNIDTNIKVNNLNNSTDNEFNTRKQDLSDETIKCQKIDKKEEKSMEKTIEVKGMMCGHCEMHVKKALEGISGVKEALVDHNTGIAKVELSTDVTAETLTKAVVDAGYEVVSIK